MAGHGQGHAGHETRRPSDDWDELAELSSYLEVLGSSVRLKILRFIAETPKDAREIARDTGTSYENVKKHLEKLLSIGVVRKEAGISSESAERVHLVWRYVLVPGGMEAIIRTLSLFSSNPAECIDNPLREKLTGVRDQVSRAFFHHQAAAIVLGGPADGSVHLFHGAIVNIGRIDQDRPVAADQAAGIMLPEEYRAVTRVTRPHGRFRKQDEAWYYTDCTSTGGSYLNSRRLPAEEETRLSDGDLLELGKGPGAVRLLIVLPGVSGTGG